MLVLEGLVGLHRTIQLQLLQHYCQDIDLDYRDIEWSALEMVKLFGKPGLSESKIIKVWVEFL